MRELDADSNSQPKHHASRFTNHPYQLSLAPPPPKSPPPPKPPKPPPPLSPPPPQLEPPPLEPPQPPQPPPLPLPNRIAHNSQSEPIPPRRPPIPRMIAKNTIAMMMIAKKENPPPRLGELDGLRTG